MTKMTTRLNLWNRFKNEGYPFWYDENVNKISNGLENNNYSGTIVGYCIIYLIRHWKIKYQNL